MHIHNEAVTKKQDESFTPQKVSKKSLKVSLQKSTLDSAIDIRDDKGKGTAIITKFKIQHIDKSESILPYKGN